MRNKPNWRRSVEFEVSSAKRTEAAPGLPASNFTLRTSNWRRAFARNKPNFGNSFKCQVSSVKLENAASSPPSLPTSNFKHPTSDRAKQSQLYSNIRCEASSLKREKRGRQTKPICGVRPMRRRFSTAMRSRRHGVRRAGVVRRRTTRKRARTLALRRSGNPPPQAGPCLRTLEWVHVRSCDPRAAAQARRAKDNSPAIHRWGTGARNKRVPSGTKERPRLDFLSPLRGLVCFGFGYPPLKRWARSIVPAGLCCVDDRDPPSGLHRGIARTVMHPLGV